MKAEETKQPMQIKVEVDSTQLNYKKLDIQMENFAADNGTSQQPGEPQTVTCTQTGVGSNTLAK